MDWQTQLGNTLHALRYGRRVNQEDVAQAVHMHVTDLSKLERGQRPRIPFATILRLAQYYGVSLDYLAGRDGQEDTP